MRSNWGQRRAPASRRGDCQQPTGVADYSSQPGGGIPTFGVSPVTARPSAVVRARGTAMGYAKYVGRVGALAVALGFGAAVATSTPGIAFADGTEPDPVQGTNQDNTPTDPGPTAPEPDPTPAPGGGTPSPGDNNAPQQRTTTDPAVKPGDPEVRSAEPGEVLATGGYQEDEKKPEEKPVLPTGTTPPPRRCRAAHPDGATGGGVEESGHSAADAGPRSRTRTRKVSCYSRSPDDKLKTTLKTVSAAGEHRISCSAWRP